MRRRFGATLLVMGLLVVGVPALADEFPPHPHMLLFGLELDADDNPVGWRKCVDLAGGRTVPLNAHHDRVHFGKAGEMLFTQAGHAVVPASPLTPWANCEELFEFFFGDSPPDRGHRAPD